MLSLATKAKATTAGMVDSDISNKESELLLSHFTPRVEDVANLDGFPVKRVQTLDMGAVNTIRLKSCHEKGGMKKLPISCTLCGGEHRDTQNCERRKALGKLVDHKTIDNLVNELICRNSPVFLPLEEIPEGSSLFQQINPQTNYIVIHNYATIKTDEGNTCTNCEDTSYLCVTQIFEMGVTVPAHEQCFVRSTKVTTWMTKKKLNRKHVIIGSRKKQKNR